MYAPAAATPTAGAGICACTGGRPMQCRSQSRSMYPKAHERGSATWSINRRESGSPAWQLPRAASGGKSRDQPQALLRHCRDSPLARSTRKKDRSERCLEVCGTGRQPGCPQPPARTPSLGRTPRASAGTPQCGGKASRTRRSTGGTTRLLSNAPPPPADTPRRAPTPTGSAGRTRWSSCGVAATGHSSDPEIGTPPGEPFPLGSAPGARKESAPTHLGDRQGRPQPAPVARGPNVVLRRRRDPRGDERSAGRCRRPHLMAGPSEQRPARRKSQWPTPFRGPAEPRHFLTAKHPQASIAARKVERMPAVQKCDVATLGATWRAGQRLGRAIGKAWKSESHTRGGARLHRVPPAAAAEPSVRATMGTPRHRGSAQEGLCLLPCLPASGAISPQEEITSRKADKEDALTKQAIDRLSTFSGQWGCTCKPRDLSKSPPSAERDVPTSPPTSCRSAIVGREANTRTHV